MDMVNFLFLLEICLSLDWTICLNSATSCLSSFTSNSLRSLATLGSHSASNSPAEKSNSFAADDNPRERLMVDSGDGRSLSVVVELVAALLWLLGWTLCPGYRPVQPEYLCTRTNNHYIDVHGQLNDPVQIRINEVCRIPRCLQIRSILTRSMEADLVVK